MIPARRVAPLVVAIVALTIGGSAGAATINFMSAGGSGGYGNSAHFTGGGIGVDVYAWAETGAEAPAGSGFYSLQTAQIWSWATGLGICNSTEGLANSTCDSSEHELDTVGADDLIVLYFDQVVRFDNLQVTVDPYDGPGSDPNDRDITFWAATVGAAPDLSPYTMNSLSAAFGTNQLDAAVSGFDAYTHILGGPGGGVVTGNLLLLTGDYRTRNCINNNITSNMECEAYKISSVVVTTGSEVVPLPAAAWLLMSALGCLGIARRRRP